MNKANARGLSAYFAAIGREPLPSPIPLTPAEEKALDVRKTYQRYAKAYSRRGLPTRDIEEIASPDPSSLRTYFQKWVALGWLWTIPTADDPQVRMTELGRKVRSQR